MNWIPLVRSVSRRFGVELNRFTPQKHLAIDARHAQQVLLGDQPVRTIFDIGANIGQCAQEYTRLFPEATIYSFEPFDDAFTQLTTAFSANRHVRPQKMAISDVPGTKQFHINQADVTNSLLPTASSFAERLGDQTMRTVRTIDVPVTTVDEFCRANSIERIDLLKMDIQGGELMALRGAAGMLARQAVRLVYTEVIFATMYEGQAYFCDLWQELRRHGYVLYNLYSLVSPDAGPLAWGDAIFLSAELAAKSARATKQ